MKRSLLPALALMLLTACTQEVEQQSGELYVLSGTVTDTALDMPLVGANVALEGTPYGAATGPDGFYSIHAIPAGTYLVRITHAGGLVSSETVQVPGHASVTHAVSPAGQTRHERAAPAPRMNSTGEEFVVVEQMPQLIGGLGALQAEIRYPVIAKKAGIEGRVILQFVVDEEGYPTDITVVRGIGAGADEESVRALQTMRFEPGRQRGQKVRVKMSLPVTFKLPADA
ncbi:MAG: TonB family protein [Rhodothermales bacterium]|nr:TonB family protein [Rhodothermales bacterium]MBO6778198.1 TonB family protein [Rhodothermales bacterium]